MNELILMVMAFLLACVGAFAGSLLARTVWTLFDRRRGPTKLTIINNTSEELHFTVENRSDCVRLIAHD